MAFGSNKQAVIAKPSFKERLTGVKSMFKKAHEDASKLNTEMQNEIDNYKMLIASYEVKIEDVSTTQKETQEFMSNLEKFI